MVQDGNWVLLSETGICTSSLLRNIDISVWEGEVSPACCLQSTGFCMYRLNKLVNTIEGIIKCFGILAKVSSELLDSNLQVLVDQLRGILLRLRGIMEEGDVSVPPSPTYGRRRRNRLIFPQPREALRRDNEIVQRQGQIELVPIARLRICLRDQTEARDNQVLKSPIAITQTQVEDIDIDSDSDVPNLIDSQGNIVN